MLFSLQKKSGVVKSQEKKERWKEKKVAKRQKREDEESAVVPVAAAAAEEEEEEENVQPAVDPLEKGFLHHAQREQERMNERLLKRTYSKKNKTVSPLLLLFVVFLESSVRANQLLQFSGNPPPVRQSVCPSV